MGPSRRREPLSYVLLDVLGETASRDIRALPSNHEHAVSSVPCIDRLCCDEGLNPRLYLEFWWPQEHVVKHG